MPQYRCSANAIQMRRRYCASGYQLCSGTRRAVRRWRARATRAKETLAKAETMSDADAREMMRAVAASYERLVERLEKEAAEA